MLFIETELKGAYIVELERVEDHRGFFARTFSQDTFKERGIDPHLVQCSISFNRKRGTLRGMHYQTAPHQEAKLIRCTQGAIYDVIVDLRSGSSTFQRWVGVDLRAENYRMLYVPEGFAHGFQTLADNTEVFYQMSEYFHPECARGVRWNDPALAIDWPLREIVISQKDSEFPFLQSASAAIYD